MWAPWCLVLRTEADLTAQAPPPSPPPAASPPPPPSPPPPSPVLSPIPFVQAPGPPGCRTVLQILQANPNLTDWLSNLEVSVKHISQTISHTLPMQHMAMS